MLFPSKLKLLFAIFSFVFLFSPVTSRVGFAMAFVVVFQAEKLCGSVELGLGPDAPLLVKYELESADKAKVTLVRSA